MFVGISPDLARFTTSKGRNKRSNLRQNVVQSSHPDTGPELSDAEWNADTYQRESPSRSVGHHPEHVCP